MVFDFIPSTEKHELLVFPSLINAPAPGAAVRSRVFAEMQSACLEDSIKVVFLFCLDDVSNNSKDRCMEGDAVRRGLFDFMSINEDFHRWVK